MTEIKASDGKLYISVIFDCYNLAVLGLAIDTNMKATLCEQTLDNAYKAYPMLRGAILHSERGTQYTSELYRKAINKYGILQSMSKAEYPYDNAPMERYFNTLKNERRNLHEYHTKEELYASIEEFAYVWYNPVRPHSYNGYQTPFEARYRMKNN